MPNKNETPPPPANTPEGRPDELEGEGSYTATRRYNEGLARSVAQGDAEERADEAAAALDGPEGPELRRAEAEAKKGRPSPKN